MFYEQKRPGGGTLTAIGIVATILVHGGIIALVFIGRAHASGNFDRVSSVGQFVDVQAVKFGKPRDLSFLPHKEAPQSKKAAPKIALSTNDKALPKPPKSDDPKDKTPDVDPLKRIDISKLQTQDETAPAHTEEGEGDPNGLRGGSSTVGHGPVYLQHLSAAVANAWNVPTTITDDQLASLAAQACIKMDATGKITEFHLEKTSHNEQFDATLLAALGSIKQFDPPSSDVRDALITDGICLNFKKTTR